MLLVNNDTLANINSSGLSPKIKGHPDILNRDQIVECEELLVADISRLVQVHLLKQVLSHFCVYIAVYESEGIFDIFEIKSAVVVLVELIEQVSQFLVLLE